MGMIDMLIVALRIKKHYLRRVQKKAPLPMTPERQKKKAQHEVEYRATKVHGRKAHRQYIAMVQENARQQRHAHRTSSLRMSEMAEARIIRAAERRRRLVERRGY